MKDCISTHGAAGWGPFHIENGRLICDICGEDITEGLEDLAKRSTSFKLLFDSLEIYRRQKDE